VDCIIGSKVLNLGSELTLITRRDLGYASIMQDCLPAGLRSLTLFEEFDHEFAEYYEDTFRDAAEVHKRRITRAPKTRVCITAAVAAISTRLERLCASFFIDAASFFEACHPDWVWVNLTWLTLTSSALVDDHEADGQVNGLLLDAAKVAMRMPKLVRMELWNSVKHNDACVFRYGTNRSCTWILWCGTWQVNLKQSVIEAWVEVGITNTPHQFLCVKKEVRPKGVKTYDAAARLLGLQPQSVHPFPN
jgi:hypothetical protein